MLPCNFLLLFLFLVDSGVEVPYYYKLVGGRRVTELSVQVGTELLSGLFCVHHLRALTRAYDEDEAFVAAREAKLHKPFIYGDGKAGILF